MSELPGSSPVVAGIRGFTASVRRVLVTERLCQAVAFGFAALVAAVLLDRALRLPPAVRVLELAALAGGGIAWAWLRVVPALRFRPPDVEVALRIERGSEAARGRLAVGVDLASSRDASIEGTSGLVAQAIERAQSSAAAIDASRIDRSPMRRAVRNAMLAVAMATAVAVLSPGTARTALLRLLVPFADVQWPARTMVESAMDRDVHPRGVALALKARTVRGDPQSMRVDARYRVAAQGQGSWRTVSLSPQPDGSFERLVETDGDELEVSFATEDMETLPVRVRLVNPPSVASSRLRAEPPAYAAATVGVREADLGTGTDRRSTLSPPLLAGSRIELSLVMKDAAPPPVDPAELAAWAARTVRIDAGAEGAVVPSASVDPEDAARWTIRWNASGRGVVELLPTGAFGVVPSERIAFEVPATEDAPPTVAVVEPAADEAVTPDARPLVVAEARDDLMVTRIWLDVSVVRAAGGSEPAFVEDGKPGTEARVERTVDIGSTGAGPGDRVVCVPRAIDAFERDGARREPVAGTPRVFRVIAASELADQVRSRLGQMREAASRLREEQAGIARSLAEAAKRTDQEGAAATEQERTQLSGTQARMSDRVASFERSLEELAERLERNKAGDEGLRASIDEARSRSSDAATAAQQAADRAPKEDGAQDAARSASEAEQALADLEASLQRDRETAELARRIDRLAERVEEARKETAEASKGSAGKSREQLPEDARARLDRAAQSQREAATEARALAEDLGERAEQVDREEQGDAAAAESMREAQREADDRGLARQLEQAAQATQENRAQQAQQAQQQAQQALQAMQEAMRNQQKRRMEELERRVAEAVDAIRALLADVDERTLPVQGLAEDRPSDIARESAAVLRLSQNAAGVGERTAAAGQELRRAASLVLQGASQLDSSAGALRSQPVDLQSGRTSLESARQSLQDALAAADKARKDAEEASENRRREELRAAYGQALERQRSARAATEAILPPPGKPADRRAFVESKRIALEQSAVTGLLEAIGKRADISGSDLYLASNQEMVGASMQAAQGLSAAAATRRMVLLQREVEQSIAALMEALSDPPEADDPFAQAPGREQPGQQGGGGQGGNGNDRVPPMAELRLLRTLAQRVLDDTASARELPDADRAAYLGRVADRQRRLLELGERWMKAMQEQQPRAEPMPGNAPDLPEASDAPDAPAGGEG